MDPSAEQPAPAPFWLRTWWRIRWRADVASSARVARSVRWAPGVRIGPHASIGERVTFGRQAIVGEGAEVLAGSHVDEFVPIFSRVGGRPARWLCALKRPEHAIGTQLFAAEALKVLLRHYRFNSVLDVGSGAGEHARRFREAGKSVTCVDLGTSAYAQKDPSDEVVTGDFLALELSRNFDCIWASHVLEHQPNPQLFLRKIHALLREGGILALTVPPLKHDVVGGHLTLWNPGLLLVHLVLSGFDCREVALKQAGYDISCLLVKRTIDLPPLHQDFGDIDRLRPFLPHGIVEPFDGRISELNWPGRESGSRGDSEPHRSGTT